MSEKGFFEITKTGADLRAGETQNLQVWSKIGNAQLQRVRFRGHKRGTVQLRAFYVGVTGLAIEEGLLVEDLHGFPFDWELPMAVTVTASVVSETPQRIEFLAMLGPNRDRFEERFDERFRESIRQVQLTQRLGELGLSDLMVRR